MSDATATATALDEKPTTRPGDASVVDRVVASSAVPSAPVHVTVSVRLARRLRELATFGLVGGIAFVVDVGLYNLLRVTVLDDKPIGAKVISVIVATAVAWLGNRYLTFRADRGRAVLKEAVVFGLVNVGGLAIASLCLFVSHYVLGHTSQLADNVAANGVGLVLGTAFRYVAYRWFVFAPSTADVR